MGEARDGAGEGTEARRVAWLGSNKSGSIRSGSIKGKIEEVAGGVDAACAVESGEFARGGAGEDEPLGGDGVVLEDSGIAQEEGAGAACECTGEALDAGEVSAAVGELGHQEARDAGAGEAPGEVLGEVDVGKGVGIFVTIGPEVVVGDVDPAGGAMRGPIHTELSYAVFL